MGCGTSKSTVVLQSVGTQTEPDEQTHSPEDVGSEDGSVSALNAVHFFGHAPQIQEVNDDQQDPETYKDKENLITEHVLVPTRECADYIIGESDAKIKKLAKEMEVEIHPPTKDQEQTFKIIGKPQNVNRAQEALRKEHFDFKLKKFGHQVLPKKND